MNEPCLQNLAPPVLSVQRVTQKTKTGDVFLKLGN